MARAQAQKVYVTRLVVHGAGRFPVDMLRYDSCTPWNETDSHRVGTEDDHGRAPREITLRRFSRSGEPATTGRWNSFGWTIVEEKPLKEWME